MITLWMQVEMWLLMDKELLQWLEMDLHYLLLHIWSNKMQYKYMDSK